MIIPNYNHARYLDQRIQTVLDQTYQNFEVIILDDCSTDNSLEVIEKYKDNSHISQIVVNERNSGNTFIQWDKGLHLAKGDLVWIAESDDYCELNLLEELVNAYRSRRGTVLAYNTTLAIYDDGTTWNQLKIGNNQYMSGERYIRHYLTLFNWVMNVSCAIFSKEVALNISQEYITLSGAGDYLFWVEIASHGDVAIVNKKLSYFCRHGNAVTDHRQADGTNPTEEKKIYNIIRQRFRISPLRNRLIMASHRRRLDTNEYVSSDVYSTVSSLWNFQKYNTKFDEFILRVSDFIRNKFNYFI